MSTLIVRRLVLALPTILVVSFLAFSMIRLNPDAIVAARLGEAYTPEAAEKVRHEYGLDRPMYTEYFRWMGRVLTGDLGESAVSFRPVAKELAPKIAVTLELAAFAVFFAVLVGVPVGIVSAMRQDGWPDYILRTFSILGLSVPGFYVATVVLTILAVQFDWIPPLKYVAFWDNPVKNVQQFAFPALILSLGTAASVMRFTRTMMLDVLRQDYIRTAWAKGLRERAVVVRHALKNVMLPVITILGLTMANLVGGTVIFESIFSLPGVGSYLQYAVFQKDFAPIQAVVLLFASSVIIINLVVDISYTALDPRARV
ncbi:MAG: ABC transporter permease [Dehalococcoidia bacterium]|nr:ABC transporter permease [Dehalococcoidia bacterium]